VTRAAAGALALLAACAGEPVALHELHGEAQGTTWTIKYAGGERAGLAGDVGARLAAFDAVFSLWQDRTAIRRFNEQPAQLELQVEPELAAALRQALALARATGGAFDPTLRPLLRLRGFGPAPLGREPDAAELAAARDAVGHELLTVRADGTVVRARAGVQLDLDGIAQGLAVDELAALLQQRGIDAFMIELGGELRCAGTKPDGSRWAIGIEAPDPEAPDPGAAGARGLTTVVPLADASLATSGSYRRFVESGGRLRHHILDRRTGDSAAAGVVSASVIAADCATADALSTALVVLGPVRGVETLARLGRPDLRALLVLDAPVAPELQAALAAHGAELLPAADPRHSIVRWRW
jgi:thiamine biosynthesis lipoprotein